MSGVDRDRLTELAVKLEAALLESDDEAAPALLDQLRPLLRRIAAGQVDQPVRVPGHRLFIESSLPGDPAVSPLWTEFGNVAEGIDTERFLALLEAKRRAREG